MVKVDEDLRQAPEYGRFMEKIGWKVAELSVVGGKLLVFIRKIGPVSIAKIQRPKVELNPNILEELLRKNRVFMCKYEPTFAKATKGAVLLKMGFKQDNWPLLATKTLQVDLTPSEEKILNGFNKDARYCIRRVQDTGYKVQRNEFDNFYKIWSKANKIKRLWTPNKKEVFALVGSFGTNCFCVTINDLGGCLVLMHQKTAYYFYSGTLPEGKKYDLPYAVVWEAMRIAKKQRMETWDFEGIFDSRWPNPKWKGFSHFKKSFGGTEIEYPGCFTKWRWPF